MHWNIRVIWIFLCNIILVAGRRDPFESKCQRNCNTEQGKLECWNATTNGFAYGLSTAMIDFCQVIVNIRNTTNAQEKWYNITRDVLSKELQRYELEKGVKQLPKEDIEQIAISLLNQCFNVSSSTSSFEQSCPSCSNAQIQELKRWRLSSIILTSVVVFLILIILLLYALDVHHTDLIHRVIKA